MIELLLLLALLGAPLPADEAPTAVSGGAEAALTDEDVYYAPIDEPQDASASAQAAAPALAPGAFLSRARVSAFDIADQSPVQGAEVFLAGQYLGRTPLQLEDRLIGKPVLEVDARKDGYSEGLRPAVVFPAAGELAVALVSDDAASWYTTPAWAVGLGLLVASAAVYDANNSTPGLALAGGGLAVISLSQLSARFLHLPSLRRKADAYNGRSEPVPALDPTR